MREQPFDDYLRPEAPFIWPEARVLERICSYGDDLPFESVVGESDLAFGVITALNGKGIEVLEAWITGDANFRARFVIALYPTCRTTEGDLYRLLELTRHHSDRLAARIKAYPWVNSRPVNAICLLNRDSGKAHMVTGPSENLGFDSKPEGKVNFAFRADPPLVEAFNRYFTWLWGTSVDISSDGVTQIPALVLPSGSEEGARLWREYIATCDTSAARLVTTRESVQVDPTTGDVQIVSEGEKIPAPTEDIGVPKLDTLAEAIARLYGKGELVSVDKLSRIPPLDAPIDPSLFGDASEVQKGNVTRRVSMRVSIIDEKTLKEIEKRRQGLRALLSKFTFALADNMRWMPTRAKHLFEKELQRLNEEGLKLISELLQNDVDAFVNGKRDDLVRDISGMYKELGKEGQVTKDVIDRVIDTLKVRLRKAQVANFMPKLSYSVVSFAHTNNALASPWGQAFSLLADVAAYPRKALTDSFFFRGLKVSEDDLIEAMNVADDELCRDLRVRGIKDRCKVELDLLARIEKASLESRDRCEMVWRILSGGPLADVEQALKQKDEG